MIDNVTFARELGAALRTIREEHGWQRSRLTSRLTTPVSFQTIASWELGTRAIPAARLVDVCAALGVSASAVLSTVEDHMFGLVGAVNVDLMWLSTTELRELHPARAWAQARLCRQRLIRSARLTSPAVELLAELCGVPTVRLIAVLREHPPTQQEI